MIQYPFQKMELDELLSNEPNPSLRWKIILDKFPHMKVAQVSSLGLTGMVILDYLDKLFIPPPVIFLDTLYHFPETLIHLENVKKYYKSDIITFTPKNISSDMEFESMFGPDLHTRDPDRYAWLTKVEPTERALSTLGVDIYITGRRRDQATSRENLPFIERDEKGRLVINLLADWTWNQVQEYIASHPDIPVNPLYKQGYTSVGDIHSTVPSFGPERSGRWPGTEKMECGMHTRRKELENKYTL